MQSLLMSSCGLTLKFELSDEKNHGAEAEDVQVIPALRHVTVG